MEVVYTHDIFSRQTVGGISRYYVELIRRLSAQGENVRVLAGRHGNRHLSELEGNRCLDGQYVPDADRLGFLRRYKNRQAQERKLTASGNAVVHHTYYSFDRPLPAARLVVTIHDMIPERFPELFGWKARFLSLAKRRSCQFADQILAISETTKSDLVNWHGIDPAKIQVTSMGNSLLPFRELDDPNPYDRPYLLYVGGRPGYKNCRVLFEAFASSPRLKRDFSLICFGGGEFSRNELEQLHRLGITDHVRQIGGDDRTLSNHYRHAAAFICPSIYEGFGIPAVEAMSFGCPVIASDRGSLPEVVGPAGVYFDPHDSRMLADALESVLDYESVKQQLRKKMPEQESRFRWENTAEETLRCYKRAAA